MSKLGLEKAGMIKLVKL